MARGWDGYWFRIPGKQVFHKARKEPRCEQCAQIDVGSRFTAPVSLCGVMGYLAEPTEGNEDLSLRCKNCLKVAARIRKANG
jgi:hypothetical protein